MAKKKNSLIEEAEKIKSEIDQLKKKKTPSKSKKPAAKTAKKPAAKTAKKPAAKAAKKPAAKKPAAKTAKKPAAKTAKKPAAKAAKKTEEKPAKVKKLTKKELEEAKKEAEKTLEEELEEQLSDEEIENFQIEKVDMERLTNRVYDILAERESDGMFQSELWKKLKLTSRDGSRLALKLERMGTITREKILEKGRWTYKLIIKKTPISTQSIENAPCLVCPVEQKCSLEGEISPRNCQFIEDWVIAEMKKPAKSK
ncbi:MAG: transcriptional regulator [Nitrosopumilus sp.]|uniref:helix-turn-helix transcriptional regulator n=1 Tax=Nitrosopumilus sp. TaxID=2024843 RepID=UPI00247F1393|nr:transcriptional regulator [Nitrosopumilus sp.]MCV0392777.1 transcriptional regulator [Nitrosopumilus sp.]